MPQNQFISNPAAHTTNDIRFNTTDSMVWISGYAKRQNGTAAFDDFHVIPLLLEPGGNLMLEHSPMPRNMSGWRFEMPTPSDTFDAATGFYNITVPAIQPPGNEVVLMFVAFQSTLFPRAFVSCICPAY